MTTAGRSLQTAVFALSIFLLGTCGLTAAGDADAAWQKILETEKTPPAQNFKSRDQARVAILNRLSTQESALRQFRSQYPRDPRSFDAALRLASVMAVQSDLLPDPSRFAKATAVLNELATAPGLSTDQKADIEFAILSLKMRRIQERNESTRDWLTRDLNRLKKSYPKDTRLPRLMVEVASFYGSQPKVEAAMLHEALELTSEPELRMRISDDLKRLDLQGHPLALEFESIQGNPVSISNLKGVIVIVYFFAEWSPPAVAGLRGLAEVIQKYPSEKVTAIGISLDKTNAAAKAALATAALDIPVYCDGKSWESALVRSFGINALPTIWVVDRRGVLRILNARENLAYFVRALLSER